MKFNRFFALPLIVCAALTSCLKSEYRYSGYVTFADVVDGTHLNGDGDVTYLITEDATDGGFTKVESGRVVINCDLLDANRPQSIKLNLYKAIDVKPCLKSDELTEEQRSHIDSLVIRQPYIGVNGDNWYATLLVGIPKLKDSKTEHELDLVFDRESTSRKIILTLYHNANGDVFTKEAKEEDKSTDYVYISFPVKNLIQDLFKDGTEFDIATAFDRRKEELKKEEK